MYQALKTVVAYADRWSVNICLLKLTPYRFEDALNLMHVYYYRLR